MAILYTIVIYCNCFFFVHINNFDFTRSAYMNEKHNSIISIYTGESLRVNPGGTLCIYQKTAYIYDNYLNK